MRQKEIRAKTTYDVNPAGVKKYITKVHRSAPIACVDRAAQWRHKKVELAAHKLLQEFDKAAGIE